MQGGRSVSYTHLESFLHRTIPWDIQCWDEPQLSLIHGRVVETDLNKARRVADSLRTRISVDFYDFIKQAYLTCLPDKELQILILIHKAYSCLLYTSPVGQMLQRVKGRIPASAFAIA